uniref:Uncharacterized protein n=1 Tax=Arundo donax TaxID=35708 RepID=A0A0A8ZSB6_ARUDO
MQKHKLPAFSRGLARRPGLHYLVWLTPHPRQPNSSKLH